MIRSIKMPLQYLDDVIDAAKSLSDPDAPPLSLPEGLSDAENELNIARVQSQETCVCEKRRSSEKTILSCTLPTI